MAVVIGSMSQVDFGGNDCVISAQWGFSPNPTRLYCIGEWEPSNTYYKPTKTLSITVYAPSGISQDVTASQSCEALGGDIVASVAPGTCEETVEGVDGNWYVSSYSYTKEDSALPGQESWSLQQWVDGAAEGLSNGTAPDYVIRTTSEGQCTDQAITGVELSSEGLASYTTGSVSANSVGKADATFAGIVVSVGGGSSATGVTGNGSASVSYNPLYIGAN